MKNQTQTIIKIFLASPGGLDEERRVAKRVTSETNDAHAEKWGLQFKLVAWEETVTGNQRAQSLINEDLKQCTYFFGIIHDHWGSPPFEENGKPSKYTSGFEEEFDLANQMQAKSQMHDIYLSCKEIDADKLRDPGESLKKVLSFKKECARKKKPFYATYKDVGEFEIYFRKHLTSIGYRELERLEASLQKSNSNDFMSKEKTRDENGDTDEDNSPIFAVEEQEFLETITSSRRKDSVNEAQFIARLRLIAASHRLNGNSKTVLEAHDANLIYRFKNQMKLSRLEIVSLARAGIKQIQHQNSPLWHWVMQSFRQDNSDFRLLKLETFSGDNFSKVEAFKLLNKLGIDQLEAKDEKFFTRKFFIEIWFSNENSKDVAYQAFEYLTKFALKDDIEILEGLKNAPEKTHKPLIQELLLVLKLRFAPEDGLKLFIELDLLELEQVTFGMITKLLPSQTTDQLSNFLKVSSNRIRKEVVKELIARDGLSTQEAELLSSDNFIEISYLAIEYLENKGVVLNEKEIEKKLTKKANSHSLSRLLSKTTLDLSRFSSGYLSHLHNQSFKSERAFSA